MKSLPVLLALLAATGCTAKAAYENIQYNRHNYCIQQEPERYDACMERVDKSYDEYRKELEEYEREREEYEREKAAGA